MNNGEALSTRQLVTLSPCQLVTSSPFDVKKEKVKELQNEKRPFRKNHPDFREERFLKYRSCIEPATFCV